VAGGDALRSLLARGLALRREQPDLVDGSTDCYRLIDGEADGLPNVQIDVFAGRWLVQTRDVLLPAGIQGTADLGWRSLWWKKLEQTEKAAPEHIAGEAAPQFTARENGLSYHIDFSAGYSQGIFLDQRIQRRFLASQCHAGQSVLNLFAYTCAFSVAAAAAGAATESIDLSRNYLDWGKRNFLLNGIDPDGHFFCRGDSFDWLQRLARKGRRYDFIILDPPTFSRNDDGKIWRAERDYPALVDAALAVLQTGGRLLCSTNHHGLTQRDFVSLVRQGFVAAGRTIHTITHGEMPADFRGSSYLKVVWFS
jgi:23S rRNA (cytosine1962-C5)-methyltransferase